MKLQNFYKKIKTTLLGLALIALAAYLLIEEITFDYWIIGGLLIGGSLLCFSGQKFIDQLEKKIFGSSTIFKKEDNDNNDNRSI